VLLGDGPADRWSVGFAGAASSAADAKEAVAAIPADGVDAALLRRDVAWRDDVGRAYSLAGDAAHGLPLLRGAARTCDGLRHPIEAVHASADLGAALEATGDTRGACDAYAKVVEQWGAAKPRSITADRAKQRILALKCAP
jgi:serine/threonine-protein kinase